MTVEQWIRLSGFDNNNISARFAVFNGQFRPDIRHQAAQIDLLPCWLTGALLLALE